MYAEQSQTMRDEASVAHRDREIVLAATEQLQQENKNLLDNIASLQDQITMYKKLLSPHGATTGLDADRLDLRSGSAPGRINYRLVLTQISNGAADISGVIEARLIGGGQRVILPVGDNRFAFQYFQNLTGEWQLPSGFHPERVDIILKSSSKGAAPVQKSFRWEVQP
jgi:hypothetical protein